MSMTNCVNCGSAKEVSAAVCPFCGTSYFDLTDIDLSNHHPCIVRFKFHDAIFQMKAFVGLAEITQQPQYLDCTSLDDYHHRYILGNNEVRANIEFICVE